LGCFLSNKQKFLELEKENCLGKGNTKERTPNLERGEERQKGKTKRNVVKKGKKNPLNTESHRKKNKKSKRPEDCKIPFFDKGGVKASTQWGNKNFLGKKPEKIWKTTKRGKKNLSRRKKKKKGGQGKI